MPIVTGDTKVVQRGLADGLYITTTGVGEVVVEHDVSAAAVREGDAVLLSGSIGDHAAAVLAARGEFHFELALQSDCAPLWSLVEARSPPAARRVRFLRDPTRGGLTSVLAELAESAGLGVEIEEERRAGGAAGAGRSASCSATTRSCSPTRARWCSSSAAEKAEDVLAALRRHPLGAQAARIGAITTHTRGAWPCVPPSARAACSTCRSGELLPRIC